MAEWTEELKQQVVKEYQEANPTAENSSEIVAELAEKHDKTPNGIRMILIKAEVYVKKTPATGAAKSSGGGGTRVNKQEAIAELKSAIEATGQTVDDDIIDKLTGKAAKYFADIIKNTQD